MCVNMRVGTQKHAGACVDRETIENNEWYWFAKTDIDTYE